MSWKWTSKNQWDDQVNSCLSVCLQLFWEKRLKGLRSSDVTEQVLRTMDLPKGLQSRSPTTAWAESSPSACLDLWPLDLVLSLDRCRSRREWRHPAVGHCQRSAHELRSDYGTDVCSGWEESGNLAQHVPAALQGLHRHRRAHPVRPAVLKQSLSPVSSQSLQGILLIVTKEGEACTSPSDMSTWSRAKMLMFVPALCEPSSED